MPKFLPSEKSEPRFEAHQHEIMLLLRRPSKWWVILLVVLGLAGWIRPWPMGFVFVVIASLLGFLRWRLWAADRLWLTSKRIIHAQGVIETARTESWLRLDRISGMHVTETWLGSRWNYASIHIDAPGEHSGTHNFVRIRHGLQFYDRFRQLTVEGRVNTEAGYGSGDDGYYITEELPTVVEDGRPWRRMR